jgi:hypothetical protein
MELINKPCRLCSFLRGRLWGPRCAADGPARRGPLLRARQLSLPGAAREPRSWRNGGSGAPGSFISVGRGRLILSTCLALPDRFQERGSSARLAVESQKSHPDGPPANPRRRNAPQRPRRGGGAIGGIHAPREHHALYGRGRWKRLRRLQLAHQPLCRMCEAAGRIVPAVLVDHIKPAKDNVKLFFDINNLQSLCRLCQMLTRKHRRNASTWTPTLTANPNLLDTPSSSFKRLRPPGANREPRLTSARLVDHTTRVPGGLSSAKSQQSTDVGPRTSWLQLESEASLDCRCEPNFIPHPPREAVCAWPQSL